MSRHQHRHGPHDGGPPISPVPPIPPIPPVPPFEGRHGRIRFGDVIDLFANRGRGWRGSWGPFSFDFGDDEPSFGGRGFGGGGGRRGRRKFDGSELRLILLKMIGDQPRHGYELIKAIEEKTGGEYAPSPGIVYPTLTMLDDMGFVREQKSKESRKIFEVTDEGRAHLDDHSDQIDELLERLDRMAPRVDHNSGPAIGRAVKNLMTALSHRVGRDGLNEQVLLDVAAILDEAAQKIERVR